MNQSRFAAQGVGVSFVVSPTEYFRSVVIDSLQKRKLKASASVTSYLVSVLEYHLDSRNLFDSDTEAASSAETSSSPTMAELFMRAQMADSLSRIGMLKKLADRALYVSGFFSDSFNRKLIDVDYYAEIGGAAYARLATDVKVDTLAHTYKIFSRQFVEFAEVLETISQAGGIKNNESILRLYEKYVKTGSAMAKEKLMEFGILTLPSDEIKKARQD